MTQMSQRNRDWLIVIGVNLTAAFWLFWQHARGDSSAKTTLITTPIVFAVLNTVALLNIRAKNRRQQTVTPASLIVAATLLALAASGSLWAVLHKDLGDNELINLAASSKPISAIRPAWRGILVQLLRERLHNSRDYDAAVLRMKPISPPLYSAESFENENVIESVLSQTQAVGSLSISYADKQQEAMNEFRSAMSKADPAYLESFVAERRGIDDEYGKYALLARQWLDATKALYNFAAVNHKMIRLNGSQLVFSDPKIKVSFDEQKERSVDLLNKMLAAEKEQEERQKKAKLGF
jgi:hypothetical protein